jgi:hypothetical protein
MTRLRGLPSFAGLRRNGGADATGKEINMLIISAATAEMSNEQAGDFAPACPCFA